MKEVYLAWDQGEFAISWQGTRGSRTVLGESLERPCTKPLGNLRIRYSMCVVCVDIIFLQQVPILCAQVCVSQNGNKTRLLYIHYYGRKLGRQQWVMVWTMEAMTMVVKVVSWVGIANYQMTFAFAC